jgi:hypothetical protein
MSDRVCTCGAGDHPSVINHADSCPLAEKKEGATVLVFRNQVGQPVAVPENVVHEAERPYRAYRAHLAGKSWAEIAREERYADAGAAAYDVKRYVEEGKALITTRTRRDQLQLEVARLDALQAVVWDQAMTGHLPAIKEATNLIATRSKLLGLAEMAENEGGEDGPRTVIIPSSEDYEAGLRKAANEGGS